MIEQTLVERISAQVADHAVKADALAALRSAYPQIHFTYCMDDDVPVIEAEGFNLYLVDGSDHCMQLTRDYEAATGVLIAECGDEEGD